MRTTPTAATQLATTTSGATSRKKYAAAPAPTAVASRIVSRLTAEAPLAVCARVRRVAGIVCVVCFNAYCASALKSNRNEKLFFSVSFAATTCDRAAFARGVVGASRGVTAVLRAFRGSYARARFCGSAKKTVENRNDDRLRARVSTTQRSLRAERARIIKPASITTTARRPFINQPESPPPRRDDLPRFRFLGPRRIPRRVSGLWRSGCACEHALDLRRRQRSRQLDGAEVVEDVLRRGRTDDGDDAKPQSKGQQRPLRRRAPFRGERRQRRGPPQSRRVRRHETRSLEHDAMLFS